MKRASLIVLLAIAMVLSVAGVALAARYDSTYYDPEAWVTAYPGVSPHGVYTSGSVKCNVCHAVHNPGNPGIAVSEDDATRKDLTLGGRLELGGANSEYLLRSDAAGSCQFCHMTSEFAIKQVYNEDPAVYQSTVGDPANAHNYSNSDGGWPGFGCTNCHQVHGATTLVVAEDSYLAKKILKGPDVGYPYDPDTPAFTLDAGTVRDATSIANETKWCTRCHTYYNDDTTGTANPDTHIMKAALNTGFVASSNCESCHDNGNKNQLAATDGQNNYPHYTTGARFLNVADRVGVGVAPAVADANGQVKVDGACVKCHINGAGDAGIGITR